MYNNKKYREFEKVLIAAYINSIGLSSSLDRAEPKNKKVEEQME